MSYPNIPLGKNDQDRRVSQAVNHLLNQVTYYTYTIEGIPDGGQEVIDTEFPVPVKLVRDACVFQLRNGVGVAPTANVTITFSVGGSTIATGTMLAGETTGSIAFTSSDVPAFTRFLVTAPNPQDATFSDFIISLAVSE